ncbi:MAG TPA: hypothetical protein VL326_27910 [Kofleriaceae bacterium]|nr:hypothetical protein [Kofleriaceae bacterium]
MNSALACTNVYTDIEEDFFRAGDEMTFVAEPVESARKNIFERLFERPLEIPSDDLMPEPPARMRPPTEKPVVEPEDDEWDWMIAAARARARHATQPGF